MRTVKTKALKAAYILFLALAAAGCAGLTAPLAAPEEPVSGLSGQWRDTETGTVHSIEWDGAQYHVVSCLGKDGEVMIITAQTWHKGVLSWTYKVPSTGYTVKFTTVQLRGNILMTKWSGTAGSGTQTLERVRETQDVA